MKKRCEDHKGLLAATERAIAKSEAERAKAAERVEQAKQRITRIENGEEVSGGLGKPLTQEDFDRILREAGMTTSGIRHCVRVAELHNLVGDAGFKEIHREISEAKQRAERAIVRANLRAYYQLLDEDER